MVDEARGPGESISKSQVSRAGSSRVVDILNRCRRSVLLPMAGRAEPRSGRKEGYLRWLWRPREYRGQEGIIGMDVGTSEDGAFWLAFLRSLSARGLSGS